MPWFLDESALAAVRWLQLCAITLLIGAAMFAWRVQPALPELLRGDSARRLVVLGRTAVLFLLVAIVARLFQQAAAFSETPARWLSAVELVVLDTTWGVGWRLQLVGWLGVLLTVGVARRRAALHPSWMLHVAALLALSAVPALSGHAIGAPEYVAAAVVFDTLHVIGAGLWLGTLMMLVLVGFPVAFQSDAPALTVAALLRHFSPVALIGAALLLATGGFATWLHFDTPASLWRTTYGQRLLIKLGILVVMVVLGAYNWKVATPALAYRGEAPLRRAATLELVCGVLVLAVTALLVATPLPGEE